MTKITDWLLRLAAIVIVVLGLKAATDLITQILLIVFIAVVISPIYYWLKRHKVPDWLSIVIVIVSMVGVTTFCILGFVTKTIQAFEKELPTYKTKLVSFLDATNKWFVDNNISIPEDVIVQIKGKGSNLLTSLASDVSSFLISFFQEIVIILIIVSFILCELPTLPKKVKSIRWVNNDIYNRMLQMVIDIRHYMGIKTIISAITGLLIYIGLMILGVPSAPILGIIAFILNFIPVFGSILATIIAVIFTLINCNNDIMLAFYVAVLYLAVNQVLGNILEPKFMGKGFGISPVIVLLAVIIWGWILGPVGMLLAVPLTMAVKSSLDSLKYEKEDDVSGDGEKQLDNGDVSKKN